MTFSENTNNGTRNRHVCHNTTAGTEVFRDKTVAIWKILCIVQKVVIFYSFWEMRHNFLKKTPGWTFPVWSWISVCHVSGTYISMHMFWQMHGLFKDIAQKLEIVFTEKVFYLLNSGEEQFTFDILALKTPQKCLAHSLQCNSYTCRGQYWEPTFVHKQLFKSPWNSSSGAECTTFLVRSVFCVCLEAHALNV